MERLTCVNGSGIELYIYIYIIKVAKKLRIKSKSNSDFGVSFTKISFLPAWPFMGHQSWRSNFVKLW